MKSSIIGVLSEKVATTELLKAGYQVSLPVDPGSPYDLLIDNGTKILKAQVKTARKLSANTLTFHTTTRNGVHYRTLVDVFLVFYPETETLYCIPASHVGDPVNASLLLPGGKTRSDSTGLTHEKYLFKHTHTQALASEETTTV